MSPRDRLNETTAMLLIGDGLLAAMQPRSHCLVWRARPAWWRSLVDWCADHPAFVRGLGAAEVAAGVWLARRQAHAVRASMAPPGFIS